MWGSLAPVANSSTYLAIREYVLYQGLLRMCALRGNRNEVPPEGTP